MEARELRIGNLFLSNTLNVCTVRQIYDNRVQGIDNKGNVDFFLFGFHVNPIPLTEEWLERLGFKSTKAGYKKGMIRTYSDGIRLWVRHSGGQTMIHYVHQLQNLYYALTGEELTLKEIG